MARAWVWRVLSLVQPGRQEEGLPRCSYPEDAPFRVQAHRAYKGYASFQFKKKNHFPLKELILVTFGKGR